MTHRLTLPVTQSGLDHSNTLEAQAKGRGSGMPLSRSELEGAEESVDAVPKGETRNRPFSARIGNGQIGRAHV